MASAIHDLTDAQWAGLVEAWGGCAYCGADGADGALQRDCVQPLSRGGRYTLENVVPACRRCNASKCNHEVTTWMRRLRLDERAFLGRFLEVRALLTSPTGSDGPAGDPVDGEPTGDHPDDASTGSRITTAVSVGRRPA